MPVAVVTGGTRGIGRAIVLEMAAAGFDVAFCYRSNAVEADALVAEVEAGGRKALARRCDVSDHAAMRDFAEAVEQAMGAPDLLCCSAGITRDGLLVQMAPDAFSDVIATNLVGTFNACRAFAFGMMKEKRGAIVTLSSVAGVFGNKGQANYAASKAGIIGLSLALAKELGGANIRVNVVAPGFIDTDMTGALPEALRADAIKKVPLKRFGLPEEVAGLVAFLASDRARYITGQVLRIDGGLVI